MSKKMTFLSFIEMANLKHNNKYSYIEDTFENSHAKTLIGG
jgi:hypothetical protein